MSALDIAIDDVGNESVLVSSVSDDPSLQPRGSYIIERIIFAGKDIVAGLGVEGLTMKGVAAVAKVSRQTLYRHFPSKDALVAGLFLFMANQFEVKLRAAIARDPAPESRLQLIVSFGHDEVHGNWVQELLRKDSDLVAEFVCLYVPRGTALIEWALEPLFVDAEKTRNLKLDRTLIAELVVRTQISLYLSPAGDQSQQQEQIKSEILLQALLYGNPPTIAIRKLKNS